ncbi:MAG: hypothetical protein K2O66_01230, partial [Bacteroidales bacterium]|nr:hypothetical protein [Bacteroidales bacterium]
MIQGNTGFASEFQSKSQSVFEQNHAAAMQSVSIELAAPQAEDNGLMDIFSTLADRLETFWNGFKNTAREAFGKAKETVSHTVTNVVNNVRESVGNMFSNIKDTVTNVAGNIRESIGNVFSNIKENVANVVGNARESIG